MLIHNNCDYMSNLDMPLIWYLTSVMLWRVRPDMSDAAQQKNISYGTHNPLDTSLATQSFFVSLILLPESDLTNGEPS